MDIKYKKTRMKGELNRTEIRSLDSASEKGASSCLSAMPLKWFHFDITITDFRDGLFLSLRLRTCEADFTMRGYGSYP